MSKVGHWLKNSVVSRIARGPGFESRSGHDFFLPCDISLKKKKNNSELLTCDQQKNYCHKNRMRIVKSYAMPRIDDTLHSLAGSKYFTNCPRPGLNDLPNEVPHPFACGF